MSSNGERGSRGNGSGGGGGAATGGGPIPESARKMVQRLKEIVSYYSDQEIYAALKECNMDPDDAISRLLNQDTFHEVKSKRDKKKEGKDASESKPRGVSNTHRGVRVDRSVARPNSNNTAPSEYGTSGKHAMRKDNGPLSQSSILGSGSSGNTIGRRPSASSSLSVDAAINDPSAAGAGALQTSGYQQPWSTVPGQPSMADIVKMGRPRSRSSTMPAVQTEVPIPHRSHNAVAGNTYGSASEKADAVCEHISHDGWSDQLPDANRMNAAESPGSFAVLHDTSNLLTTHDSKSHMLQPSESENVLSREGNLDDESLLVDTVRCAPSGNQQTSGDIPEENSNLDDSSYRNFSYYESQQPAFDDHKADDDVDISSMTSTMQQLQLSNEEIGRKHSEQSRTVIFADHLQITSADCSHLSFGSFGTGLTTDLSSSAASESFKESPEAISAAEETSDHLDSREPEYYNEEQLMPIPVEDAPPQAPITSLGYDQPSCSEPEPSGPDPSDPMRGMQHNFPSSISSYQFSDSTQPSPAAHNYPEANSQVQSHAPSPNTVMAHTSSLPRHLVESAQPVQEYDLPYSHLFASQPPATRYTAPPSVSGPSASLPEVVNPSLFSMPKETLQALAGSNVLAGPSVPQNISMQQHSQPSHPLGQYANMINYPFFPQSFSYMPSTLQQTYAGLGTGMGGATYQQLQEAAAHSANLKYLPEYKNLHINNLQQPATMTSVSPNVAAAYGDALGSQFKESNPYSGIQLNESPALWPQGSSRTLSGMHANAYFNLLSQSQQSNFRQAQQQSMYGGGLGYPNLYHSQAVPQERQQNPGHMSLNGLQGMPSQPSHGSHQLWQSSYRSP